MLQRLEVSNYRSLGANVRLDLDPLTVLVGPNGSGKSNVTDVLQLLADCMHLGLEGAVTKRAGIAAIRHWSSGHPRHVRIACWLGDDRVHGRYEFTLESDRQEDYRVGREEAEVLWIKTGQRHAYRVEGGVWAEGPTDLRPKVDPLNVALPLVAGDERFAVLADSLRRMAVYDIFPGDLREPQKYDPAKPMHKLGTNWVSILKDQPRETWQPDMVEVLHRLTGDIVDVRVTSVGGFLVAQFRHATTGERRHKWFDALQESNGTLRVAGILTALLQRPSPTALAIEEPELTVHPGALPMILDYVREATDTGQVVLTTHSPELLDLLEADAVRVVTKEQGETSIARLSESQRSSVREGLLSLGEVLRTEGLQPQLPLAGE